MLLHSLHRTISCLISHPLWLYTALSLVIPVLPPSAWPLQVPAIHRPSPGVRMGVRRQTSLLVLQGPGHTEEAPRARWAWPCDGAEFPAGPQMLEGLNVGSIDVGYIAITQAAGANLTYVGNDPASPQGRGDRGARGFAGGAIVKGKKVTTNKGKQRALPVRARAGHAAGHVSPSLSHTSSGAVERVGDVGPFPGCRREQGAARRSWPMAEASSTTTSTTWPNAALRRASHRSSRAVQ